MRADKMSRALAWLALFAAVVLTAAGEYALFVGCGFGRWVSAAGPVCLDAYAVAAIRARREVLPAVLLMVGSNATAHLLPADGPPVGVVVAVASLAPLVLWRTHVLLDHKPDVNNVNVTAGPHLEVVADDDQVIHLPREMNHFEDVPSSWDEPWRAPWNNQPHDHLDDHPETLGLSPKMVAPVVGGWSSVDAQTATAGDHLDDQAHDHPETFWDPGKMSAGWAPVPTHDDHTARNYGTIPDATV
ncbi:hypothetical protein LZ495_05840, partial [Yinghuangia sp. KLBMP8922]|nr:hypothetical protein [Yinghuangia soli]